MSNANLLPTVEVVGPAGKVVINRADLEIKLAEGYELAEPEEVEVDKDWEAITKLTKPKLLEYAEENQIELGEAKTKPEILSVIEEWYNSEEED